LQARYKAWGRIFKLDHAAIHQPLRFQGQYHDEETGLHYNRHRFYDPDSGRYLTQDPIGLAGGVNVYGYVRGNPLNRTDPLGLADWICWASSTQGVGYMSDGTTKKCEYRCRKKEDDNKTCRFEGPGTKDIGYGSDCIGVPVGMTEGSNGKWTTHPLSGPQEFPASTSGLQGIYDSYRYGSGFTNSLGQAERNAK